MKSPSIHYYALLLASCLVIFSSCNSLSTSPDKIGKETTSDSNTSIKSVAAKASLMSIISPLQNIDNEIVAEKINTASGGTIITKTGTTVTIPPSAFIDSNGNPVTGEVELEFQEMHTVAELITSGIPMRCNKNGQDGFFKTAGMFEIRGKAAGMDVELAKDKQIEVNMASFQPGSDFEFYFFDENASNWELKGSSTPIPNKNKAEADKESVPEKPAKPKKFDPDRFVFDLDVDFKDFPELKVFKSIVWQYAGQNSQNDPEKNDWIFSENWTDVKVSPQDIAKGLYKIEFRNDTKSFTTTVTPALQDGDFDQAKSKYSQLMKEYEQKLTAVKAEQQRLQDEGDFFRSFPVTNMGIYNWDQWIKTGNRKLITAEFKLPEALDTDINKVTVFHIFDDNQIVLRYPVNEVTRFHFNPSQDNQLIALLPGNKTAVFTGEEFEQIKGNLLPDSRHTFELKTMGETITSIDDLESLINDNI